ncbi:MAG: hypothetical protein WC804_18135 [Sphingomonas sp.]|jgi:muramidase (phage lysozyme)|uniref:hypothetical protein n=1 Tax=Sphingomonas sp. TaxID=28214 RepID=UPI0035612E61
MAMLVPGNEDEGSAVGAGDGQGGDDGNALTASRAAPAGRGVEDAAAIVPSDDRPDPHGDDGLLAPPEQAAPMPGRRLEAALAAARAHAVLQEAVAQAVAGRAPSARSRAAALANTHDRDLFDRHLVNGTEALRREGMAAGKAPAVIAQEASDYRSGIVRDHLDALGMRDPVHAAADLARLRDGISPAARMQIEDGLAPSMADHRAIADVDAAARAGATAAPATPPLDPRVLLGKMQVIAPTADAAALPDLMQRYGGDAARAWAATRLGTKAVDGLIAQRGEGWYAALPEDTRQLVEHHMAMLAAPGSTRDAPDDVAGAAARIAEQDWPDDRKAAATRELLYRDHRAGQVRRDAESAATDQAYAMAEKLGPDFTSLAQIDPATRRLLPADAVATLTRQADANVHPAMVETPRGVAGGSLSPASRSRGAGIVPSPSGPLVSADIADGSQRGIFSPAGSTQGAPAARIVGADRNDSYEIADTDSTNEGAGEELRRPGGEALSDARDGDEKPARAGAAVPNGARGAGSNRDVPSPVSPEAISRNRAQAESDLRDPYFRALMTLIGRYEGPDDPNFGNGYYTINGHYTKGDGLKDLSVFPQDLGNKAVGRYQIQHDNVWSYAAPALGITGFTPHDQDLLAAYVIRRRGMFASLLAGDLEKAAPKINRIWASFPLKNKPGGRYGQAHVSYEDFVRDFATELANARAHPPQVNDPYLQEAANPYLQKRPMGLLEYYIPGGTK